MDRYGVLVFRGQALSDEQQIALTRNFGELESYNTSGTVRKREDNRLGPGMADLSNLDQGRQDHLRRGSRSGSSSWATGCGTRTARFGRSRPSTRCCPGAPCPVGAAIPSSPTCARRMKPWTRGPRKRWRRWSASTRCSIRARPSDSRSSRRKRSPISSPSGIPWCACRRRPAAEFPSPVGPCRRHRRLVNSRGARLSARPHGACDKPRVRLCAFLATARSGGVGQPNLDAPRPPVRSQRGARHAPYHAWRRSADCRPTGRAGARLKRLPDRGPPGPLILIFMSCYRSL